MRKGPDVHLHSKLPNEEFPPPVTPAASFLDTLPTMSTSSKTHRPLAQAPLTELTAELKRRSASLPKLIARREKLVAEIEELDRQIIALEEYVKGNATPRPRVGPPPKMISVKKLLDTSPTRTRKGKGGGLTLREMVGKIMAEEPMRPKEIAEKLVETGLHHGSKSLHIQVSQVLGRFEEFECLSRGQWVKRVLVEA